MESGSRKGLSETIEVSCWLQIGACWAEECHEEWRGGWCLREWRVVALAW